MDKYFPLITNEIVGIVVAILGLGSLMLSLSMFFHLIKGYGLTINLGQGSPGTDDASLLFNLLYSSFSDPKETGLGKRISLVLFAMVPLFVSAICFYILSLIITNFGQYFNQG